jgi:hypothetical protein
MKLVHAHGECKGNENFAQHLRGAQMKYLKGMSCDGNISYCMSTCDVPKDTLESFAEYF